MSGSGLFERASREAYRRGQMALAAAVAHEAERLGSDVAWSGIAEIPLCECGERHGRIFAPASGEARAGQIVYEEARITIESRPRITFPANDVRIRVRSLDVMDEAGDGEERWPQRWTTDDDRMGPDASSPGDSDYQLGRCWRDGCDRKVPAEDELGLCAPCKRELEKLAR